ncbi:hypothetical protein THF1C08_150158 [Vibrio jasicida]|uniref:Uncharacterized protein n=1 Tax=Vibrio jasicida TaxID=766224 RepID=A0AAU9QID1_9VIBR|nr:hypothetical protein THF1C08_150158 [Vibrio jasicida]CAH1579155.1 hypothetical protein THF1A12_150161 [Vibrio jasicida]
MANKKTNNKMFTVLVMNNILGGLTFLFRANVVSAFVAILLKI